MLSGGLCSLLFMTLSALLVSICVSIRGYRALTYEEVAATIRTIPIGAQRFRASVTYPDGRAEIYDLSGDSIYVDAHILKWRPWVNLLGLHTLYELDRVAGRYDRLADERAKPRTVYSLGRLKPFDLFDAARRFRRLSALVDAEYGSATLSAREGSPPTTSWSRRAACWRDRSQKPGFPRLERAPPLRARPHQAKVSPVSSA